MSELWKGEMEGFELDKAREVTLAELDAAIQTVKTLREEYDKAKALSTEKYKLVEDSENKLIALLDLAGRNSYEAEGIGRATLVTKAAVTVPKDLEDKRKLFDWIERVYGDEARLSYMTINYATLNSLYNQVALEAKERGEEFSIDGLGLPTITKTLQLRAR